MAERERYDGPIEPGMILTCPDNDGVLGYRRLRVIAEHPDGGWIIQDAPSRIYKGGHAEMHRCPEINLRIVFVPEEPSPDG